MNKRASALIDLSAIASNTRNVKLAIGQAKLCAVVKADGYGHGAYEVSCVCLQNGASSLAVAISEEGAQLRENGIIAPILVLGYTPAGELPDMLMADLTQTVFCPATAKELAVAARKFGVKAKAHIKIDTGMSRLGFPPCADSVSEIIDIMHQPQIEVEGIYTHFATSDDPACSFIYEQKERFDFFLSLLSEKGIRPAVVHASNSGAILNFPDISYDIARSGILLFGLPPSNFADTKSLSLKPAMSLVSEISSVKYIDSDTSIGYARSYYTKRRSLIATAPIGYADGYPRVLSNKASVIVNGKPAPIVGNICMDQMMIDVTDCNAKPRDTVTLLGENGGMSVSADDLADIIGTINYEIICGIGKRVPRVYVG